MQQTRLADTSGSFVVLPRVTELGRYMFFTIAPPLYHPLRGPVDPHAVGRFVKVCRHVDLQKKKINTPERPVVNIRYCWPARESVNSVKLCRHPFPPPFAGYRRRPVMGGV